MKSVPAWLITLLLSLAGFLTVWGQVRADVNTLNERVAAYEQVAQDVSGIKATVQEQSKRMDRIESKLDILVSRQR